MIDIQSETVVTLKDAAVQMPGKPRGISTLYRWAQRGLRGVQLETISSGGVVCTSWEALQRFFERIDAAKRGEQRPAQSSVERKRAVDQAMENLRAKGVY